MSRSKNTPLWVAALLSKDLTPVEFRLWMLLQRYQARNDSAWPSQETLAANMGLTVEAIRHISKRLEAAGWLTMVWGGGPGRGKEHHKRYTVTRPTETPTAIGGKTPTAIGVLTAEKPQRPNRENPNGRTKTRGCIRKNTVRNTVRGAQTQTLSFDWSTYAFTGVEEDLAKQWSEAYPQINVQAELLKAAVWCRTNQATVRNRGDDWEERYLNRWMAEAQHRAEATGQTSAGAEPWQDPEEIGLEAYNAGVRAIEGGSTSW
ncbi:MAG: helix-turn-helix domain-containing protein [Phycisphaerae bacterium]|nr:helix-turn-helix domain-containing protein [Phycisphaerae bacterium]